MKKVIIRIVCVFILLGIIGIISVFAINSYVKGTAEDQMFTIEKMKADVDKADAIIVLGAQVKPDGSLSKMLKERVDMGIQLYEAGVADKIIMTGDHGTKEYDEVNTMKDYAVVYGVPSEDVFMDHAGFSTYDSMYRAKEIFQVKRAVIVTQQYHLYRAVYDAEAMGIDAQGVSCDTAVYTGDRYRKTREVFARLKDFGYCIIKPEPKYLGEAIPVSGDGNITND